jgi:hypothetical protein
MRNIEGPFKEIMPLNRQEYFLAHLCSRAGHARHIERPLGARYGDQRRLSR